MFVQAHSEVDRDLVEVGQYVGGHVMPMLELSQRHEPYQCISSVLLIWRQRNNDKKQEIPYEHYTNF
jgi:hypothetical protein